MKKRLGVIIACVLLATAGVAAAAATYRVVSAEAALRKDGRFFAPVVARAAYGETVQSLERKGDWLRVSYRGRQGWLHISAVKEQGVQWTKLAGERAGETSRDEVALAGKGFTPEVEKAFRGKNPVMNYEPVDRVESVRATDEELQAFLRAGGLKEPEAGS